MGFSTTPETETPPLQPVPSKPHAPRHNFDFPFLKWGNQRHLRCMKLDQTVDRRSPPLDPESNGCNSSPIRTPSRKPPTPAPAEKLRNMMPIGVSKRQGGAEDDGIEEVREKLLDHLRLAADKMSFRVPEEAEESTARPWNLRTRRAACKAPNEIGGTGTSTATPLASSSASPTPPQQENQVRSMRLRGSAAAAANGQGGEKVKEKKRKLSIALSKEEIEEDFFAITGSKPPRRPKKRLGKVQRQLDASFPGLWLSEITLETYRVVDFHESKKR